MSDRLLVIMTEHVVLKVQSNLYIKATQGYLKMCPV